VAGHYQLADGRCAACTPADKNMVGVIVAGALAAAAAGTVAFVPGVRRRIASNVMCRRVNQACHEVGLITLVKVVFSFYQVVLLIQDIYGLLSRVQPSQTQYSWVYALMHVINKWMHAWVHG
jgi:hypothetical protein